MKFTNWLLEKDSKICLLYEKKNLKIYLLISGGRKNKVFQSHKGRAGVGVNWQEPLQMSINLNEISKFINQPWENIVNFCRKRLEIIQFKMQFQTAYQIVLFFFFFLNSKLLILKSTPCNKVLKLIH